MKAKILRIIAIAIILIIPFIAVLLIMGGYYSMSLIGYLAVISILFTVLGLAIYFCADKLGNS